LARCASDGDLFARLQARYWRARAHERLEDHDGAREEYAALAGEYGLSYYGWRARARLPADAPLAETLTDGPAGAPSLAAATLARPRILLEADLAPQARGELRRTLRATNARKGGALSLADRVELGRLLVEAGAYNDAQTLLIAGLGDGIQRRPAPSALEAFALAYPRAFAGAVEAAPTGSVPRALVWAIMREESSYRPAVVSSAGARGLMQLMPETGRRVALEAGMTGFTADDLFVPEVNVPLGTRYLDTLLRRFDGRTYAAIGGYNAGPEPVERWLAQRAGLPEDEWIEEIPYDQTRNYVKRVLRSMNVYETLP
jgi:soluble lytic murein transglycosylase